MILLEDVIKDGELKGRDLIILATYIEHLNNSNGDRHNDVSRGYRDRSMGERPHLSKYFGRAQRAMEMFKSGLLL